MTASRREFLRRGGCAALSTAAFGSIVGRFGVVDALAQEEHQHHHFVPAVATDYRALVCVFLAGGNDAWNTIVNLDDYAAYAATRSTIALPQTSLLPIRPPSDGRAFGFHPSLAALHSLWTQQKLAVVANVGTLVEPLTRAEYLSTPALRPPNLFSHSDQVYEWQTGIAGPTLNTGWGGRTGDRTMPLNGGAGFPMIVTVAGAAIFGTGNATRAFEMTTSGTVALSGFGSGTSSQIRYAAMRDLLLLDRNLPFVKAAGDTVTKALETNAIATQALAGAPPLQTVFPMTSLGDQLEMVARLISARSLLGMHRQIFFVSLGGFDTHSAQLTTQEGLLAQVSDALAAFYAATVEMGVANEVTLFTSSDFGRTYRFNGAGTDHGWGSCQLVLGGAVKGGDFVGRWPTLALAGPDDSGTLGRFIPTTSVDQYAATLAKWYGLSVADVPAVFPNITHFDTADLGFLA
jgi:uncharacterized protein (DUF1501 family)